MRQQDDHTALALRDIADYQGMRRAPPYVRLWRGMSQC